MNRYINAALLVTAVPALGACGSSAPPSDSDIAPRIDPLNVTIGGSAAPGGLAHGTANTERFDCAAINAQHGEGPDIVGVTIGMPAEQAFQKVACSNPQLRVQYSQTGGFRVPPLPNGERPRTMIVTDGGQERVQVTLVGLPGQERVVAIKRETQFGAGDAPAFTTLRQQLESKYGTLVREAYQENTYTAGALRSADGRVIAANDDPLFMRCLPSTVGSVDVRGDCGLSVGVRIEPMPNNDSLARRLVVSMTHGSFGMAQIDAFAAHASSADQQRRESEVGAAAGRAPRL